MSSFKHASTIILENHQEWPGRKTAELAVQMCTIVHEESIIHVRRMCVTTF